MTSDDETSSVGPVTDADDLAYLRHHWGEVYRINHAHRWLWQAVALFGSHDVLEAESADELLYKIRRHYPGRPVSGKREDVRLVAHGLLFADTVQAMPTDPDEARDNALRAIELLTAWAGSGRSKEFLAELVRATGNEEGLQAFIKSWAGLIAVNGKLLVWMSRATQGKQSEEEILQALALSYQTADEPEPNE